MSNIYYFENIASTFRFGKYNGLPLCHVILHNPEYIYWCINTIEEFRISNETLKQIRLLIPSFIIPISFAGHIGEKSFVFENNVTDDFDNWCSENNELDNWHSKESEPTYERYNGSYAQDEMGYSDDDIDTIFDGDPLAYWNID
jgi:hypothetical protein